MGDVVGFKRPEKPDPRFAAETVMANALDDMKRLGLVKMDILRVVQGFVENALIADLDWKKAADGIWNYYRHLLYAKEADFIQQLRYYRTNPSAKQVIWLDDISCGA